MRTLLRRLLDAVRGLRMVRWRLATAARLRWSGMALEVRLDGPAPASLPRVRVSHEGSRGGRLALRLGRDCRVGEGVEIEVRRGADNALELGEEVRISSYVAFKLRGGTVRIGPGTIVRDWVILKVAGRLEVGAACTISYQVIVHCQEAVTLGDHVGLADRTTVVDSGHDVDGSDVPWTDQPAHGEPVAIGRNTMVFANCVLLRGTRLGPNSIVVAGSVVQGEHGAGSVLAGSPAELVRVQA